MAGLWSRIRGSSSTWQDDFKKVTDSGVIDIPKELLTSVVAATSDADNRREIMIKLNQCLSEPVSTKWRRIHAGLVLTTELTQTGNPLLMLETAEGHHFDLVQRLSFLEKFELTSDVRVQSKIRNMAGNLRRDLVPKLEAIAAEGLTEEARKDDVSLCSGVSKLTGSTASTNASTSCYIGFGSDDTPPVVSKPAGKMVLNGIVRVGHSDDTDSEDECSKPARPSRSVKAGSRGKQGKEVDAKVVSEVSVTQSPTRPVDLLAF